MKILYIDNNQILVHGENGISTFSFDELDNFKDEFNNQDILYIKEADVINANQIYDNIKQQMGNSIIENSNPENQTKYIRSLSLGVLMIPNLDITFKGVYDVKVIDEKMLSTINNSLFLQKLIKEKKLEIIDRYKMLKLLKEQQNKILSEQNSKDKGLDSIMIESSKNVSSSFKELNDDVEVLDLTDEIRNGRFD